MQRILLFVAAALVAGSILVWLGAGANRGWTRTSEPVKILDQITGIEGIQYRDKFAPGVDFLGAAAFTGACLASISLLFRKRSTPEPKPATTHE